MDRAFQLAVVAAVAALVTAEAGAAVYSTRTMGTYANVTIVTNDSIAALPHARAAGSVFHRVDSLLSNWTTTSEVARVNRVAAAGPTRVHPEYAAVLAAALRAYDESQGAFDVTVEPLVRLWGFLGGAKRVPADSEITAALRMVGAHRVRFDPAAGTVGFDTIGVKVDLGGIAKGYAVDAAAETLAARGIVNALVDLSGNMAALGAPAGAAGWRIGIRDPRRKGEHFARLLLADGEAISTSGQYEQFVAADGRAYGHILDPRTGRPAEGLISVTVVAPTALHSDTWDTPLFVMGPAAARRLAAGRTDIAVVLVEPGTDGVDTVWVERALEPRFQLEPHARARFRVEFF